MHSARSHLGDSIADGLEIVDPLAPDRKVGKVYVYRDGEGWQVSGYYRRESADAWHPFLMSLDENHSMTSLKVQDPALAESENPLVDVLP